MTNRTMAKGVLMSDEKNSLYRDSDFMPHPLLTSIRLLSRKSRSLIPVFAVFRLKVESKIRF